MSILARYISRIIQRYARRWEQLTLPDFALPPLNLVFHAPRTIVNPERISIGKDCYIGHNSALTACGEVESPFPRQSFRGRISIGNRLWATHSLQIFSAQEVSIGDDVMLGGNVFICDCQHGYYQTDLPYKDQSFTSPSPIRVGNGCWLGQNVVVMPGVNIGEFSIIGANSVVVRSIPACSIAVGAPAQVIKKYDKATSRWDHVSL